MLGSGTRQEFWTALGDELESTEVLTTSATEPTLIFKASCSQSIG